MWLFLKYSGGYSTPAWEALGAQRLDGDVWRFPAATDEDLKALIDRLTRKSEGETLRDTYACLSADAAGDLSSLDWLKKIQPFAVFSARCLHPWLNGSLDDRIHMHFQPVVDLSQGGRIVGYEALCRLAAPGGALLNGKEAFALAAAAQRAADLDKLCQNQALRRAARDLNGTPLFLKALPQNLLYAEWRQSLLSKIEHHGLDPRGVVIEVVECEQVEAAALAVCCEELRREGLRVALDDIGSGGSGLAVMAAVRADFVKINRTLIHEAQGSQVRAALVEALVSMSQRLGATTIGKGLERGEDVSFCREMGIMWAQGYFFAAPSEAPPAVICSLPGADDLGRFRPASRFRLDQLVDPVLAIDIREPYASARKLFEDNTQLPLLVVVDDGRPVGLLKRGQVFSRSGGSIGKACIPIQRIIPQQLHDKAISRFLYLERLNDVPWVVVSPQGSYQGILYPMALIAQIMAKPDPAIGLNPLSMLPTGPRLRQTLDAQLNSKSPVVLVYIDLDNFKAYNDRYGFIRGDAMIRLLAEQLRHAFLAKQDVMLGHIGGDDFILVLDQVDAGLYRALQNVMTQFHSLAMHLYDEEDVRRGFFETEDGKHYPIASISVGIVNGCTGRMVNAVAAAERAAYLKKVAKGYVGSVIVTENAPPDMLPVETGAQIGVWEQNAVSALQALANVVHSDDPHALDDDFTIFPYFEMVFELDATGIQRYPNWLNPAMYGRIKAGGKGVDRSHQTYFARVASTRSPYISPIYLSSATEDFCLTVSLPLFAAGSGQLTGVLVADINIASMAAFIAETPSLDDRASLPARVE